MTRDDVIKKGAGLKQGIRGGGRNEIVIGIVILGGDQSYANLYLSLKIPGKWPARSTREKKFPEKLLGVILQWVAWPDGVFHILEKWLGVSVVTALDE